MPFEQGVLIAAAACIGLTLGSFLNACVYRLHAGISIVRNKNGQPARSFCPHCKHTLGLRDLVPVVSYIALAGKCRYCHTPIHWQYPAVEVAAGVLCALVAWRFGWSVDTPIVVFFCMALLFIFLYDLLYQLILDSVTLPLMPMVFVLSLVRGMEWKSVLLGALVGGGFFAAQYMVSRGKWIGGGDIRLGVLMGLMLGLGVTVVALFLAYIVGACVAVYLLLAKRADLQSKVAFGTFLTAATVVCLLRGPAMLQWYLQLLV